MGATLWKAIKWLDFFSGDIDIWFCLENQSSSMKGVLIEFRFQINHRQLKLGWIVFSEFLMLPPIYARLVLLLDSEGLGLSAKSECHFFVPYVFQY